jgi:hypothetical protein
MRSDFVPGAVFPNYELSGRIAEYTDPVNNPMIPDVIVLGSPFQA